MKLNRVLILLCASLTLSNIVCAEAPASKTVVIIAYDTMKYSVTKIEAQPGEKIVVELKSEGNMPKEVMGHNWVLLKAGVDPLGYCAAALSAKEEGYMPKTMAGKVLASIPLLGPKESGKATFTAPTVPGSYAYVCSFPGHSQAGMLGALIVK